MDGPDSLVQFRRRLFVGHAREQAEDGFPLSGRERPGRGEELVSTRIVLRTGCERIMSQGSLAPEPRDNRGSRM